MMRINSFYMEFEPVDSEYYKGLRRELAELVRKYNLEIITFETGLNNVPSRESLNYDIFGSTD